MSEQKGHSNSSDWASSSRDTVTAVVVLVVLTAAGWLLAQNTYRGPAANSDTNPQANTDSKQDDTAEWESLFDGKSLNGWTVTDFGGQGEVYAKDGQLILEMANADLTGVTTTKQLPKSNYEVQLEAKRVNGNDFFCGLTFPVKSDPCSLILGGWGGGLCGLSSIDGLDASENETTSYQEFKNGKWYHVRLQVTDDHIKAWLENEQIVNQSLKDHQISIRFELDLSRPFGIATYQTTGALRDIRIRKLDPDKINHQVITNSE